ncbi:MAG: polysaccharide deacetylase family protein [Candidatus Omnitrophota bacterium]|nr:MAG: polysaccharide deacetylase family protein [Candidatus Omnitrophota bacterium]
MSIKRLAKNKKLLTLIAVAAVVTFMTIPLFLDAIYVPVIIMYHSVNEEGMELDGYEAKLNVSPAAFAKQMKFLHERNYNVIPLAEFIERIERGENIPRMTVAITFDDGLKNNFLHALPVLKKYNFPATIFVATDFVGKEGYLTRDDIKIMQENNISIGSHTVSHNWLPALDEKSIHKELWDSKKLLEEMTGREIKTLSYPLGGYNEKVKKIARKAGYIGAVATNPGRRQPKNDIFALKRIRISMTSDNLLVFLIETSGYYAFIKEIRDED